MTTTALREMRTGSSLARGAQLRVDSGLADLLGLGGDLVSWPAADRQEHLRWVDRVGDTIGVLRAGALMAEQAAGTWRGGGDRSFDAWPWSSPEHDHASALAVRRQLRALMDAVGQVARVGTPAQNAAAADVLDGARRDLYRVLADGPSTNG